MSDAIRFTANRVGTELMVALRDWDRLAGVSTRRGDDIDELAGFPATAHDDAVA